MSKYAFGSRSLAISLVCTVLSASFCFAAVKSVKGRRIQPSMTTAQSASSPGSSITLLPDGRTLVTGGQSNGSVSSAVTVVDPSTGAAAAISPRLKLARAWHTATVLPNGTVLIMGGIGRDGQIVKQDEVFDPPSLTFRLLVSGAPNPRAFHTATLLTDGTLLIAGGVGASGQPLKSAELWDFRQGLGSRSSGDLNSERRNHAATLLADGTVLLSGGTDGKGNPLQIGELYDPSSRMFTAVPDSQSLLSPGSGITETKATSPEDGATEVSLTALISMRFSRPLLMPTIDSQTIALSGPQGTIDARVIGAESGMLAFVSPRAALLPGTVYSVTLSGATDGNNQGVAYAQITFTTAGDAPLAGEAPISDTWTPTSDWMTHNPISKSQSLSPLQAPLGVTALAGQVLKLDGSPLAHVNLQIGNNKAFTDGTGRFLLTQIPAGHSSMRVIANTANSAKRSYGIYEIGVDITATVTNVLRYTIWMTPLDTAHTVTIPSPTATETIVRSPLLPGLELHIPPNTVITGYDGKVVTQINITPIPLDRPPFPLPNVPVPIYFTIQPGSAYFNVKNTTGPMGAWLYYPNAYNYAPGTPYAFWNYDPDAKGWYVYGDGRVSADRSQIAPNPGVVIYELTGAMVSNPTNAPTNGPKPGNNSKGGEPVDLGTGLFTYSKTDLVLHDVIPLVLTRTYRPNDPVSRTFGIGTNLAYDFFMVGTNNTNPGGGYLWQDLILPDGGRVHFQRVSPCTGANGYCDFGDAIFENLSSPTDFYGATIQWQGCPNGGSWTLKKKDGTNICFLDSDGSGNYRAAAPVSMSTRYGNSLTFTRGGNNNLTQITSPNGRWIQLTYDSSNRVIQAADNINRTVRYVYDSGGRLTQETDANGGVRNYTYDAFNNMLTIQDPRGIVYLSTQYDANGRVIQQTQADNTNFYFSYTTDPITGNITQTDVTDPRGVVKRTTFDANGYKTSEILALGKPEQQTIIYNRDPNTTLINSITDGLGRQTSYTYDSLGNTTSVTRLAGTSSAATTSFTYDPIFNQLTSIIDPLNHTTTFQIDASGNVQSISDPLNHQHTFTYNAAGQVQTATDAMQDTTRFSYDSGDLVGITDPMNDLTMHFVDSAGRLTAVTNALSRTTRYSYNSLDKIVQVTDPLQGITSFTYDGNGNVLTIQDARQGTTTYAYNNRGLLATRTDQVQRQESYSYDSNGNVLTLTDRKGQVTSYTYDNLNRLGFVGFGTQGNTYASTISFLYDAANRTTKATDSISGVVTRGYDGFDRLTSETTPQGTISYTYDNAGRRATMQVTGQPPISYGFDSANRLTQIAQGSSTIGFTYDNTDRRSTLTLPNGIVASYSYDTDSHLTGISYSVNSNSVGSISYGYDALGMRISASGSLARTDIPQPMPSASYDAANELVAWNEYALSYDPDGNMLSDGVHSYGWDARNHLSTIDSGSTGSFVYDPSGRRATKTIFGVATSLLYDLSNPVQELNGTTPVANIVAGTIDEYFTRTDINGTASFLTDALGSTLALADSTGTLQTLYKYDPYGNTTQSGTATTNSYDYTGREMDGTGLQFYRARYYNPQIGRFISEDPMGFRGGINKYAYVGDSPLDFIDPFGLRCATGWDKAAAIAGGLGNIALGTAKIALGLGATVETGGLAAGLGYYSAYSGLTNVVGGVAQLYGGITGNITSGQHVADYAASSGSVSGLVTLGITGNAQAGATASAIEGIGLASAQAALVSTGTLPTPGAADDAATAIDNGSAAAGLIIGANDDQISACDCH
jgi:RHS repeat-associated protein